MSVTIVRQYWRHIVLGLVRVVCITLLFFVTGLLLANQNADTSTYSFPTKVPGDKEQDSLLFMAAACFQIEGDQFTDTVNQTFATPEHFKNVILDGSPDGTIIGWDKFIFMGIWYVAALLMEIFDILKRGSKGGGKRKKFAGAIVQCCKALTRWFFPCCIRRAGKHQGVILEDEYLPVTGLRKIGHSALSIYLVGGVSLSVWTVIASGIYMRDLRAWVRQSQWLAENDEHITSEDDATTFGQLVPICMSGLILFSIIQMGGRTFSPSQGTFR